MIISSSKIPIIVNDNNIQTLDLIINNNETNLAVLNISKFEKDFQACFF